VELLAERETEQQWLLDGVVQHPPLLEARFAQLAVMEGAHRSLITRSAIMYYLVRGMHAGRAARVSVWGGGAVWGGGGLRLRSRAAVCQPAVLNPLDPTSGPPLQPADAGDADAARAEVLGGDGLGPDTLLGYTAKMLEVSGSCRRVSLPATPPAPALPAGVLAYGLPASPPCRTWPASRRSSSCHMSWRSSRCSRVTTPVPS
jgi:hypothetical protein